MYYLMNIFEPNEDGSFKLKGVTKYNENITLNFTNDFLSDKFKKGRCNKNFKFKGTNKEYLFDFINNGIANTNEPLTDGTSALFGCHFSKNSDNDNHYIRNDNCYNIDFSKPCTLPLFLYFWVATCTANENHDTITIG
jgi:hypothetical protein